MGNNRNPRVRFNCDFCGKESSDRPSHYAKKKRHFCSQGCYANFVKHLLPKEEQNAYGTGHTIEERKVRIKARSVLNHYLRDNDIDRPPCEICGNLESEAHHDDYLKPLEVRWLCFKHHRLFHKIGMTVYENPELLSNETKS